MMMRVRHLLRRPALALEAAFLSRRVMVLKRQRLLSFSFSLLLLLKE